MKFLSVCSGIEAASVAWEPLGMKAFAFSEIEAFPSAVLAHHYPTVPNLGDMTKFQEWPDAAIDILVGGTPCQSFSVAGLRKGLADPRGNLMLTYLAIAAKYQPSWLVWENVPGVLSSNKGRDFGTLLAGLGQLGYGFAYRVLDAQYFGVPQRRRRVFVVGYLGDWRAAAAVLFERHSLQGHPAPGREKGQGVAGAITAGSFSGGAGGRPEGAAAGHFQAVTFDRQSSGEYGTAPVASTVSARDYKGPSDLVAQTLLGKSNSSHAADVETYIVHGTQDPCVSEDNAFALGRNNGGENVVAAFKGGQGSKAGGIGYDENLAPTLSAADSGSNRAPTLMEGMQVRRLTPRECERLQGFPDDYTLITYRNKPAADGPRYKALGNSMAVPVMRWIGERIQAVESIKAEGVAA